MVVRDHPALSLSRHACCRSGAPRSISVWQEHDLEGAIAVEQHAPDARLPPHMDLWLRRCKYPVRAKWLAHDEPL